MNGRADIKSGQIWLAFFSKIVIQDGILNLSSSEDESGWEVLLVTLSRVVRQARMLHVEVACSGRDSSVQERLGSNHLLAVDLG